MELRIFWTAFAENELQKIFQHYRDKAGYRIAKKLVLGIQDITHKLGRISLLVDY